MNLLIINTSGEAVTLVMRVGNKIEYYSNDTKEMASVVLLSEIDNLLNKLGIALSDIDYFAVVIGPGSFTGIRIGVASVRAFCQSLKKKVVAVNRLELLAYNNRTDSKYTVSVVDGQNGIYYVGVYSRDTRIEIFPPGAYGISELKSFLERIKESFTIISDSDLKIEGYLPKIVSIMPQALIDFTLDKIKSDKAIEYTEVVPAYIRKSQAERQAGDT